MTTQNTTGDELSRQTSSAKSPQPNNKVFPFLDLPAEIRLLIYQPILPQKVRVKPVSPFLSTLGSRNDRLALLRTCRQLRHEARPQLFSDGTVTFDCHDEVCARCFLGWIDGVGDGPVSRLKRFDIVAVDGERVVRATVRAAEAGAVVTGAAVGVFRGGGNVSPTRGRRGVLRGLNTREWTGSFSVADVKTIVYAVGGCMGIRDLQLGWPGQGRFLGLVNFRSWFF
ncbi:hypothetical protein HO133_007300 [Letharia lupina]|uniref:F-box domain-containing protein n=1 Tax=Letharia lupina TaxID=560253 RepID=A0A8H6KYH9_9LECA|nr:uncharacterized protein HO133_007300 [Letharia lupina]KAF6229184.1 hypothetical protein HO133_007300 [Letharia lupina]